MLLPPDLSALTQVSNWQRCLVRLSRPIWIQKWPRTLLVKGHFFVRPEAQATAAALAILRYLVLPDVPSFRAGSASHRIFSADQV